MKEVYPKRDPFKEPSDDFYRGRFQDKLTKRKFGPSIAIGALAVILFVAIIWYSYPSGDSVETASVPMIYAEADGFKTQPKDPGGIDVPFQDSVIFNELEPAGGLEAEKLLPEAEEALNKGDIVFHGTEEVVIQDETGSLTSSDAEALLAEAEALLAEAEGTSAFEGLDGNIEIEVADSSDSEGRKTLEVASVSTAKPIAEEVIKKEAEAKTETETVKKAALTPVAPSVAREAGRYAVQLGSLTSREAAQKEWGRLQKVFGETLSGLDLNIQEANLSKGTFYRIQAGSLSQESAAQICDALKAKNPGGCLVVKR